MATIETITIQADDAVAAERFYSTALGFITQLRVEPSTDPTSGFRGFTLSLVVSQPATVDRLIADAVAAGATATAPAKKSLWGYGGAVQAPDGTIVTVASSKKKNTDDDGRIESTIVQLGVADVRTSREFYLRHGFTVAKSYGNRYVELATGPVTVTLTARATVAKVTGLPVEGSGSHRLVLGGDVGGFTDPDGYAWAATSG